MSRIRLSIGLSATLVAALLAIGDASASAAEEFVKSGLTYPVSFTAKSFSSNPDVFTFHNYALHCESTTLKGTLTSASPFFEVKPEYHCGAEETVKHEGVGITTLTIGCNYEWGKLTHTGTGTNKGTTAFVTSCKDKMFLANGCKIATESEGPFSKVDFTNINSNKELEIKFALTGIGYTEENCPGFGESFVNGEYKGEMKGAGVIISP